MPNKYEQKAEVEIDLHGHTMLEAGEVLDALFREMLYFSFYLPIRTNR